MEDEIEKRFIEPLEIPETWEPRFTREQNDFLMSHKNQANKLIVGGISILDQKFDHLFKSDNLILRAVREIQEEQHRQRVERAKLSWKWTNKWKWKVFGIAFGAISLALLSGVGAKLAERIFKAMGL